MLTCKDAVELRNKTLSPKSSHELLKKIQIIAGFGGTSMSLKGLSRDLVDDFVLTLTKQGFYFMVNGRELDIFWDNAADEAHRA